MATYGKACGNAAVAPGGGCEKAAMPRATSVAAKLAEEAPLPHPLRTPQT